MMVAGTFVDKHREGAITSKHQRTGANEHSKMLHTYASGKTIDEGPLVFYAPVKTSGPTGSLACPPGIAATAATQLLRGFKSRTFP